MLDAYIHLAYPLLYVVASQNGEKHEVKLYYVRLKGFEPLLIPNPLGTS